MGIISADAAKFHVVMTSQRTMCKGCFEIRKMIWEVVQIVKETRKWNLLEYWIDSKIKKQNNRE